MKQVKLRRGEVSVNRSSSRTREMWPCSQQFTTKKWFKGEEMQPTKNQNAFQITTSIWGCGSYRSVAAAIWNCKKVSNWYKKLAIHFLQLAMLNSFLLFKKDGGRKRFVEFQHDVISVLVFGQDNEAHHDIPREENVVRLTERHFVEQIPPTDSKQKAQKRCRVC